MAVTLCPGCCWEHDPREPHNAESVFFQLKFRNEHKRPPSWEDAMQHCTEPMKGLWRAQLEVEGYPDTGQPLQSFFRLKKDTDHMEPSERLQGQDAMYAEKRPNARRVTLSHVTDCIKSKTFFRADANGPNPDGPLTICIFTMRNGFFIIGKGATIDPFVEFDEELGEQAAYDNAITQVFEKEAYVLMDQAWREANATD